MRPMTLLFWGMLIVVADIRLEEFDVLVDLVGWAFVINGVSRVRGIDPSLQVAHVGAVLGAIGSVPQLVPGLMSPGVSLAQTVEIIAGTLVVVGVCTAVARLAVDDPGLAGRARALRTADIVTSALSLVSTGAHLLGVGPGGLAIIGFAVVSFAVLVLFLVLVWTQRRRFDRPVPALPYP